MKIYIIGDKEEPKKFEAAENVLRQIGHAPINPVKVMRSLPKEVTNADFTIIAFELIKICDAVYLLNGWEKDLFARMEYAQAEREEKEVCNECERDAEKLEGQMDITDFPEVLP